MIKRWFDVLFKGLPKGVSSILDYIYGTSAFVSYTGTATRSNMGADLSGTEKWFGGVLGPDGKIYGISFDSTTTLIIGKNSAVPSLPKEVCESAYLNKL